MDEEDGRSAREGIQIPEKVMKALEYYNPYCQNYILV